MKYAPLIASILLGGLFIMSAVTVLFNLAPMPELPKDTPIVCVCRSGNRSEVAAEQLARLGYGEAERAALRQAGAIA